MNDKSDFSYEKQYSSTDVKKLPRKRIILRIFLFLCFLGILLHFTLFKVRHIEIVNNIKINTESIKEKTKILNMYNIFMVTEWDINRRLSSEPYFKSAEVVKKYPNTVILNISERKPRAYVEYKELGSYFLVDEEGYALEVISEKTDSKPVIVGLDYKQFVVGEQLKIQNMDSFRDVVELSNLMELNQIEETIKVDISDHTDIHLHVFEIDVSFGTMDQADRKIQVLKEILSQETVYKRGFLDIRDVSKHVTFKHMK